MELKDINYCKICKSTKLKEFEQLIIDDVDNDGEMTVDAKVCECGVIHFIENGYVAYQFFANQQKYEWVPQVSDQEVELAKMQ